jgi:hypothetical protein
MRAAIEAVRKVILKNLDKDYEEGMSYGMIGYYVPHRVYPAGYHCDPKLPLPFANLASQKNHATPARPATPAASSPSPSAASRSYSRRLPLRA